MRFAIPMRNRRHEEWYLSFGASSMGAATRRIPLSTELNRIPATIYELDPLQDPRWAALIESHSLASVFHSPKWLRTLQIVYGYQPVVVTTCPPGIPLTDGVVFCDVKSWLTGRRFVSLPFSDHCDPLINCAEELEDVLLHLGRNVSQKKWNYIEIRPLFWEPRSCKDYVKSGTYHFHRLDLRRSAQELFHNFHKDCVQRQIRRGERENLQYEEGTSDDLLHKFYRLL